jgi:predicted Zn-dependent protease
VQAYIQAGMMKYGVTTFASTLILLPCFTPAAVARGDLRTEKPTRTAQEPKIEKGGKDDIDAIGNRDIGGRGLGNWYSLEREIRMGKEYAQMIDSSMKLVQDPTITEYVNRIGQNIVRNSDSKVPFTIKVIDAGEINAFALPGGFLYVHSGLLLAADEEAELAGVIAHEVAHVAARHAVRQMTRANWAHIASIPLIFVGGGVGYAAWSVASIGVPMTFMKFSREFEEEADYLGLQYMYKAGYDPQSFMTFFEKVQAKEKQKPGTVAKVFASHPPIASRIARTQKQIDTKLQSRPQYVVTKSEFDDVRTRLALIENRHRITDVKDNKPTLRRAPKTADDTETENDRPTLKRRDNSE